MKPSHGKPRNSGRGALLLVPLLAVAIGLVIYFVGFGGRKSYVETVGGSKKHAERTLEGVKLAGVYRVLQQYAADNGKFPPTPQELIRAASLPPGYVFDPTRPSDDHLWIYLGGQNESMPPSNVLIYEAKPRRDGTRRVLRLGGQVEALPYEQVQAAIEQTKKYLK